MAASDERRTILSILAAEGRTTIPALATTLASHHETRSTEDVTSEECLRYQVALEHVHLPVLEHHDVIAVDGEDSTIETLDAEVVEEPLASMIEPDSGVPTRHFEALGDRRRLWALKILGELDVALATCDLALHVLAVERDCPLADVPIEHTMACRTEFHHRHVPHLADADLVDVSDTGGIRAARDVPRPVLTLLGVENPPCSETLES